MSSSSQQQQESHTRDGAKRRGVSLGPQASQILQRLYEPQLGPGSASSPDKQQHAGNGAQPHQLKHPISPLKKDPQVMGTTAMGGGSVLKPKQQTRMKKTSSVATLAASDAASHHPILRNAATGGRLLSSASVAILTPGMHPTLLNVRPRKETEQERLGKLRLQEVADVFISLSLSVFRDV